jgi:hypothetical protein
MSEETFNLLVVLITAAGIVAVVYLDRRRPERAPNDDGELLQTMQQILDNTRRLERSLQAQRRVLNRAHRQISAVTRHIKKN